MTANIILSASSLTLLAGVGIFLAVTLLLVIILLVAKHYLVQSGKMKITINGQTEVEAQAGSSILTSLANENIFLSSACGGKGSCGQCKVQVFEGGGEILPTETVHFTRKQMQDHWRLGLPGKGKKPT